MLKRQKALKKRLKAVKKGAPPQFQLKKSWLQKVVSNRIPEKYKNVRICQHVDWNEETLLNRLKAEKGVDIFASFPKLYGVVKGIRNLESYKNYNAMVTVVQDYKCKDEVFAQYA